MPAPHEPAPPSSPTPTPSPVLHTARLTLRILSPADRDAWLACQRENEAFWAPTSPHRPPGVLLEEQFTEQVHKAQAGLRDGLSYRFALWQGPRMIGFVSANNLVRGAYQNAALGWRIGAAAQGHGLAFEAVRAVVRFCFASPPVGLGLHRVEANIMPRNARSLALAQRLGMRREGLAKAMINIAGRWEDHATFALLADEAHVLENDEED